MSEVNLSSPDAHDHLITNVKALAGKLIRTANYHKNLSSLKAQEQLVHKIKEIFFELEQQDGKLRDTLTTSEFVLRNLENLMTSLVDVEKFFDDLTKIKVMMFAKSSEERKLQNILHALRGKMTQLMTSISLELLSRTAPKPTEAPKAQNSMECNLGFSFFYGIGRPKNLTTAFEKFLVGSENGDTESMYMLAMCYNESLGTDKDEGAGRAWLEKAAKCGNPSAMTELAVVLMNSVDHRDPHMLAEVLRSIVRQQGPAGLTPGKPPAHPRKKPDTATDGSYVDDNVSAIDRIGDRFTQQSREWLRRNSATSVDIMQQSKSSVSAARRPSDATAPFSPSRHHAASDHNHDTDTTPTREGKLDDGADGDDEDEIIRHEQQQEQRSNEREEEDLQTAVTLLLQAAEKNYATAMTNLGSAFEVAGDLTNAAKWYEKASESGCPKATNKLGLLYFHGKGVGGVGIDKEKALAYFASAARAGDSDAHNNAGTCLEQDIGLGMGIGLPSHLTKTLSSEDVRPSRALWYYERGARMGSPQAMYSYGYLLLRSAMKAIEALQSVSRGSIMERERTATRVREFLLLPSSSNRDDGEFPKMLPSESANFAVNEFDVPKTPFATGGRGVGDDGKGGKQSRSTGAGLGLTSTTTPGKPELTEMERAERQSREGVRWLRAAAERNIKEARYQLGLVYEQGIGCPVDMPSALAQYEYAAGQGHSKAALSAANILYDSLCIAETASASTAAADNNNNTTNISASGIEAGATGGGGGDTSYSLNSTGNELSIFQARGEAGASPAARRRMSRMTIGALSIGLVGDITAPATSGRLRARERDMRRIASLYRQAADAGLPSAMNSLGLLVEDGRAVADGRPNPSAAAAWYYEACVYGLAEGFINLAMILATRTVFEFETVHSDRIITAIEAKNWMQDRVIEGNGAPKGVSMSSTVTERFLALLNRLEYVHGDDFVLSDSYIQRTITAGTASSTQPTPSKPTDTSRRPPPSTNGAGSVHSSPNRRQQEQKQQQQSTPPRRTTTAESLALSSSRNTPPRPMSASSSSLQQTSPVMTTPPRPPPSEHSSQGRATSVSLSVGRGAASTSSGSRGGGGSNTSIVTGINRSESGTSILRGGDREGGDLEGGGREDREYLDGPLGLPIALPKPSSSSGAAASTTPQRGDGSRSRDYSSSRASSQRHTPQRSRAASREEHTGNNNRYRGVEDENHGEEFQYVNASGEVISISGGVSSSGPYIPGAMHRGEYVDGDFGSYGGTHEKDDGDEEYYYDN